MKKQELLCRNNEEKQTEMSSQIKDLQQQQQAAEVKLQDAVKKLNQNQEENKHLQKVISDLNARVQVYKTESGNSDSLRKELEKFKSKHEHLDQAYKEEQHRNVKMESEMQETLAELKKLEKLKGTNIFTASEDIYQG